ncbi:hypothetical protein AVDCRST_MAG92-969 [uncultured Coleofasciculus sp.]|uniref:Uncharacterized protein n=1 Tax=uncultured Coleofasciculus sp. TaxID=1267456 RepID=A0A6J4HPY9_9CYAN|nr:hypothetical protein AVDCRST_MAG92-969 [uncultured Coleofasciculus sp.]
MLLSNRWGEGNKRRADLLLEQHNSIKCEALPIITSFFPN